MVIKLKHICKKQTITREDGKIINDKIVSSWNEENLIIIDFENILIASVSFVDEAFGKLTFVYSKAELQKKLRFNNMQEFDRALLNDILISRFHQKDLKQNGVSRT